MPTAIDRLVEMLNTYNNKICRADFKVPWEWVANYNKTKVHIVWIPQNISEQYLISGSYWFINHLVTGWFILQRRLYSYWKLCIENHTTYEYQGFNKLGLVDSTLIQIQLSYTPIAELLYLLWLKD